MPCGELDGGREHLPPSTLRSGRSPPWTINLLAAIVAPLVFKIRRVSTRVPHLVDVTTAINTRRLEPVETRTMLAVGFVLVIVGVLVAVFPRLIAHPIAAVAIWIAAALFYRTYRPRQRAAPPTCGVTPCSRFAGRGDRLSM